MTSPTSTLRRFRSLAGEFREAAREGNLDAMDRILSDRRDLIQRFGADPIRDRASSEILENILEIDRVAESLLEKQRQDLGAEIGSMESGRRGLRGYRGNTRLASKLIDERG